MPKKPARRMTRVSKAARPVPITQAGKMKRPGRDKPDSRVRKMLDTFHAPVDVAVDYGKLNLLLRRGFGVHDLAEAFLISRPSVYRILEKEETKFLVHPGIVLYINARMDELIAATDA